jgi:hypothetical protein
LERPYIRDDKISDTVGSTFAGTKVEDAAGAAKKKLGDKATGAGRDLEGAKLAAFVSPAEEHVSEPPPSVDKDSVKNETEGPKVILALDHVGEGNQAQGPAATKPVVTEDLKEIAGGATEASTGSGGQEKAGVEEGSRAAEAADAGADAKGTGVYALKGVDFVFIPVGVPRKPGMTRDDLFNSNTGIVRSLIEGVADHCSDALINIISNPVKSTVTITAAVLKAKNAYDPKKVFGVTTLDVVRTNTFMAQKKGVRLNNVNVPVIGGHAGITILSKTKLG